MNTILVVDDKASVRLLLKEYLSEQGFGVLTAVKPSSLPVKKSQISSCST